MSLCEARGLILLKRGTPKVDLERRETDANVKSNVSRCSWALRLRQRKFSNEYSKFFPPFLYRNADPLALFSIKHASSTIDERNVRIHDKHKSIQRKGWRTRCKKELGEILAPL